MFKRNFAILLSLLLVFALAIVSVSQEYDEAPMLKKKVEAGKLPPVEERLPKSPMVIQPLKQVGQYGGTWHRFSTSEGWPYFCWEGMDGFSFFRWTDEEGGLGVAPQLVTRLEANNEDKSSWTLHFREGVKWSDGEPVTVDDVLFWWRDMVLNDEHSAVAREWTRSGGELMETTKIDDFALKLDFQAPQPQLKRRLAKYPNGGPIGGFGIVPSHYLKQFHPDYTDEYEDFETFQEKQDWWRNPEMPVLTAWMPVKEEPGKRIELERNPYYYAVDSEGNQLPYIDRVKIRYLADQEVLKLKLSSGKSDMQIRPWSLTLRDISMMKKNEEKYNFRTLLWASGTGTGPLVYPNQNHPNPAKRDLYRNPKFLKALSHAIDRPRIQKTIWYGTGFKTTGTYWKNTLEFTRSEEGRKMFSKWKNCAVEHAPEKAKGMLEEIGVVDQDGDGWREMPNGEDLKLRIDEDAESREDYLDTSVVIKENWRNIGLKTIINPVDGSKISVMQTNATFDIRNSWSNSGASSFVVGPTWAVPVEPTRWAPLYGAWFMVQGTSEEGTELNKKPRDRTPPRKKPPEGSPIAELQDLYKRAKVTLDPEKREQLVFEMIKIHMEEGPFTIGTVAGWPRVGVVKDYFKNVPEKLKGGQINNWYLNFIATLNPEQFYINK